MLPAVPDRSTTVLWGADWDNDNLNLKNEIKSDETDSVCLGFVVYGAAYRMEPGQQAVLV